jgi:hypothetical protein
LVGTLKQPELIYMGLGKAIMPGKDVYSLDANLTDQLTPRSAQELDIVGVGFGPKNFALASESQSNLASVLALKAVSNHSLATSTSY